MAKQLGGDLEDVLDGHLSHGGVVWLDVAEDGVRRRGYDLHHELGYEGFIEVASDEADEYVVASRNLESGLWTAMLCDYDKCLERNRTQVVRDVTGLLEYRYYLGGNACAYQGVVSVVSCIGPILRSIDLPLTRLDKLVAQERIRTHHGPYRDNAACNHRVSVLSSLLIQSIKLPLHFIVDGMRLLQTALAVGV